MLKYIRMTASSNFGNVFSVMVASAFIPFLPMLPLHLLVQNLLYDLSQIAIPFDNVDDELVDRKSTRLNSSHTVISYAVFCLKKKTISYAILCLREPKESPEIQSLPNIP